MTILEERALEALASTRRGHQYTVFCGQDDAHEVLEREIQGGSRYVDKWVCDDFVTFIFERA